jgi:pilus assembly protein TadC
VRPRLVALAAGVSAAVVLGGWGGGFAGLVIAAALWRVLPRWLARAGHSDPRSAAADLPLAVDLVAAALRAGAPPDHAARVTGDSLAGPIGDRLTRVANALRLGEQPVEAWRYLSDVPGGDRVARVAMRSADSGAALATALGRLADELRAARVAAADAAARRAAVLVVLPLGLCFLPAFLLAGVVPVVMAVLDGVLG